MSRTNHATRGFTLVEILIATVLTLIVMGTLVEVFSRIGDSVSDSRASLEMADRLRNARDLLQSDLSSITCPTIPWIRPEAGLGYVEFIEGYRYPGYGGAKPTNFRVEYYGDSNGELFPDDRASIVDFRVLGDFDDILMFTVKSSGAPFVSQVGGTPVISDTAEVIWYCLENPADGSRGTPGMRTLHRKVRLISPTAAADTETVTRFTLGDLTKRENRYLHVAQYPHKLDVASLPATDAVLTNVLAFDLKVYDPLVSPRFQPDPSGNNVVHLSLPENKEWYSSDKSLINTVGEYVDIGFYAQAVTTNISEKGFPGVSDFSSGPHRFSDRNLKNLSAPTDADYVASSHVFWQQRPYCTWSFHYEADGIDNDQDGVVDEGTDGFDNDGVNGVDDIGERETMPPYPVALRGVKVTIRVLEPSSGQIRQVSVIQHFAPK